MIGFLAALALVQQAPVPTIHLPPRQDTDAEACTKLRKIAEDTTRELPIMVDAITRTDGMSVICALRTFTINKYIAADVQEFRGDWKARKLAQWNDVICKGGAFGPLQRRGWRFTENLTFKSGERFTHDANCN
jgi:hypothetical protein